MQKPQSTQSSYSRWDRLSSNDEPCLSGRTPMVSTLCLTGVTDSTNKASGPVRWRHAESPNQRLIAGFDRNPRQRSPKNSRSIPQEFGQRIGRCAGRGYSSDPVNVCCSHETDQSGRSDEVRSLGLAGSGWPTVKPAREPEADPVQRSAVIAPAIAPNSPAASRRAAPPDGMSGSLRRETEEAFSGVVL
jgi:hypothetical protein